MAGNEPKRHHVVPDFYLQRFAKKGKLMVVDRDDLNRRYPSMVENAAVERYFYALPTEAGWDRTVEKTLSKLETIAAVDITKLLARRSTTLAAFRTRLSFFMAVQFVRGRGPREAMVSFNKELIKKVAQVSTPEIIQAEMARQGKSITIEEATEIAAVAHDPTLTVEFQKVGPKQLPADSLVNAADVFKQAEQLIKFFYMRGWIIVEYDGLQLLTSDEPVATGVDTRDPHRPAGLVNAESIVFPLDPSHALVMMRPDLLSTPHQWAKGTAQDARAINQLVAFRGNRQIFFHPDSDPLSRLEIPGSPKHPR